MNLLTPKHERQTVVSFEGDTVKVARMLFSDGDLSVGSSYVFSDSEFDDFLRTCKEKEFVVVCAFPTFYQDVLSLPPARVKYFPTLVEMAVRKNYIGAREFLFFHDVLEEAQQEGRRTKETFVFAVDYESVSSVIDRFNKYDKTISALYPNVLTLSVLCQKALDLKDETILVVLDTGTGKTLFLLKNGSLRFVRFVQSDKAGIHDVDVDNINMTVSYFRQNLRMSPSKTIFLNTDEHFEGAAKLVVPQVKLEDIPGVSGPLRTIHENVVPLSAVLSPSELAGGNLLPAAHKSLPTQKRILAGAAVLLLLLTVGSLWSIALSFYDASVTKERIGRLRQEIAASEPLFREYETASEDLQKATPFIAYMNRAYSSPDFKKALVALNFLPMEHVTTESIQMDAKEDGLAIVISGSIQAGTFTEMDFRYRGLIDKLKTIRGMEMTAGQIDAKDMTFTIEVKWKT